MNGVGRLELTRFGPGPDGSKPEFYRMAELYFPTEAQMQSTLTSPEGSRERLQLAKPFSARPGTNAPARGRASELRPATGR